MTLKKVLNLHEEVTHKRLREICEKIGAAVFAKVRLADILPIDHSGIDSEHYSFALRSHFDFLVADSEHRPLFAVEFDGPVHDSAEQAHRDELKNQLCERFALPLLRINARYLTKTYGTMDLLTWFVDVWFLERAFVEAQEAGSIPWDEPFDHKFLMPGDSRGATFPWWLSADVDQKLRELSEKGRCWDPGPSWIVAQDAAGSYRAIGYIRLSPESGVICTTAMRKQQFPAPIDELLGDIVAHELYQRVLAVLRGEEAPESVHAMREALERFNQAYDFRSGSYSSRGAPLKP